MKIRRFKWGVVSVSAFSPNLRIQFKQCKYGGLRTFYGSLATLQMHYSISIFRSIPYRIWGYKE